MPDAQKFKEDSMLTWIKNLFSNSKTFIKMAVDSLDLAVPYLAAEIDKSDFSKMTSTEKAQLVVDKVQDFLRKQFKIPADA